MTKTAPLESQVGLVQLTAALDKAFMLAPKVQDTTMIAARVVVDDDMNRVTTPGIPRPIIKSARRRITGFIITNNDGAMHCNRWRYSPPTIVNNVFVGRPAISVTRRMRARCHDCGYEESMFEDTVISATRNGNHLKCRSCRSTHVYRYSIQPTCSGKGELGKGDDELFPDEDTAIQELGHLDMLVRQKYDPDVKLILPRLWCGYSEMPLKYEPTDRLAEIIVKRGLNPPVDSNGNNIQHVAYMVPFDVMYKYHRTGSTTQPHIHMLSLETIGDSGWVDIDELTGHAPESWGSKVWTKFPSPRPIPVWGEGYTI